MKAQLTTGFGNNPISLRDGATAIFRRRALVLFTFFAVVTGTILVTLLLPNRYDSRMKILVKNQRVDVAITAEATNGLNAPTVDNEVSENQINSEIELLTSKDLLMQVVNETGLAKSETDLLGRSAPEAVRAERAVNRLTKDLSITPVRKANIITVSYSSNSPQLSATVLMKLGDLYLQKRRTQLLTKYRPDDRLVREVDEQIRTTRDALARAEQKTSIEEATDLNPLRQTLETELSRARLDQAGAKARRDTLTGQLQQYDASLRKLEGDTAQPDDLQREKKEAADNYQLYAKKREEARIADELDRQKITNISIAEAATVPQLPSSPNRLLNLVLGVFLAAFLSVGSVFSAEMLSDVVHTPGQLEALTGAKVLATVPENSRRMLLRQSSETPMLERRA